MSGPFIELTESETSRLLLVNTDRVVCVAPHAGGGTFVVLMVAPDRMEVEESQGRISEIVQAAGVASVEREAQE